MHVCNLQWRTDAKRNSETNFIPTLLIFEVKITLSFNCVVSVRYLIMPRSDVNRISFQRYNSFVALKIRIVLKCFDYFHELFFFFLIASNHWKWKFSKNINVDMILSAPHCEKSQYKHNCCKLSLYFSNTISLNCLNMMNL